MVRLRSVCECCVWSARKKQIIVDSILFVHEETCQYWVGTYSKQRRRLLTPSNNECEHLSSPKVFMITLQSCRLHMFVIVANSSEWEKEKHHPCTQKRSVFASRENVGSLAVINFGRQTTSRRVNGWILWFCGNEISAGQADSSCCFYWRDRYLLFVDTSERLLGMHVRSVLTRKGFPVAYHHCWENAREETARRQFQLVFVWRVLVFCGKIGFLFSLPYFPFFLLTIERLILDNQANRSNSFSRVPTEGTSREHR